MRANELMVGDWVKFPGGTIDKIVDLPYIEGKGICASFAASATLFPFSVDKIEPIPLTPEILEKNGFENDFYEEESVADYHTIRLEGYSLKHNIGEIDGYLVTWCKGGINVTTDFHGCVQKDISYVHELQHCLKLVGIDKKITI